MIPKAAGKQVHKIMVNMQGNPAGERSDSQEGRCSRNSERLADVQLTHDHLIESYASGIEEAKAPIAGLQRPPEESASPPSH